MREFRFRYCGTFSDGSTLLFCGDNLALARDHAAHVAWGEKDGQKPLRVLKVRRATDDDKDTGRFARR